MPMTKPTSEQVTFKSQGLGAITRTVQDKLGDIVSVKDFGAVGNGVADDTAAIQAAIDWVMYRNLNGQPPGGSVYLPGGNYRITDTIHLGYGDAFRSIVMFGDGPRYRASTMFAGTAIVADFNDRPAIAFSGTRYSKLESLSIRGKNYSWIDTNRLGKYDTPAIDDTVEANWVDPSFPASASSRYAPYCGVAIDPYAGPRPAVSYPDVNFPSWFPINVQYGKALSMMPTLRDIDIGGFVVGIAVQPCDSDGNGDYLRVLNGIIQECQYGLSIGNTQSRDIAVSDIEFARCYGGITFSKNGRQAGKLSVDVRNCSFNFMMYVAFAGGSSMVSGSNLTFRNCYSEALYGLGTFGSPGIGSASGTIGFYECEWGFHSWRFRRVPPSIIKVYAGAGVTFSGVRFQPSSGDTEVQLIYLDCLPTNVSMINCESGLGFKDPTYLYEKVAVNGTARIVIGNGATNFANWSFRDQFAFDINTGAKVGFGRALNEYTTDGIRSIGLCVYGKWASRYDASPPISTIHPSHFIDKSLAASVSQSGRTVTIDLTGAVGSTMRLIQSGGAVGDVVIDSETSTVFIVSSRSGLTIQMVAQNNLDISRNLAVTISGTGFLYTLNCRRYIMDYLHWGDTSSSSATISNVVRNDGVSVNVNTATVGVQANDYVYTGSGAGRGVCTPGNSTIASVTSNSITISGNCRRTESFVPLDIFVRAETPNNT